MADKKYQKFSEITKTQLAEWKKEHRGCKIIEIPLVEEDEIESEDTPCAAFVIKPPKRADLNAMAHYADKKQFDMANKKILGACVLGGDMQYLAPEEQGGDTDVYLATIEECTKMIGKKKARSRKL